jgi:3-isopropylmalate/(R)-2-methylmalate dehydratase small subunit
MKNKTIIGQAIPFTQSNIDTDAIIPKQYLKSIKKSGFGPFLFDSLRYLDPGDLSTTSSRKINPNFILNIEPFKTGNIIVANDNFGCGSSREHAVWALKDFGIEAIISSSFADIFHRNSFKNSLLLICISKDDVEVLLDDISSSAKYELTIDIQNQTIKTPSDIVFSFDINPSDKERIILGYDDIGLTLKHSDKIKEYESKMKIKKPWMFEDNHE